MKKQSALASLGLHQYEIDVYTTLLRAGGLSPTELCNLTKIYRPSLYQALASLEEKDLVHAAPFGKRKKYVASSPKRLKELLTEQEKKIDEEIIALEDSVASGQHSPIVTMRHGTQALRQLDEEMTLELKKGDTYYRYSSVDSDKWIPGRYMTNTSKKLRNAKDLQRFIITNDSEKVRKSWHPNRAIKTVPKKFDLFQQHVNLLMYGDKVIIADFEDETAVVIENKKFAEFQKALFKTLYHYL